MGSRDKRVDAYIDKAADFAKPILTYLRETVHAAVPDVSETMKWSFPHFEYQGLLCSMASFKAHCAFGFWKPELVLDERPRERESMGHLGKITSIDDLPPKKELVRLLRKAAKLNEEGTRPPARPRVARPPLAMPDDFAAALKSRKLRETFEKFSPSHQREYIEWITDAKSEATRKKRLDQAIEWIAEGKSRNWKYERK